MAEHRGVHERLLFHGTRASLALDIVHDGFDFRVVDYASSFGNGTYFSDLSSVAASYSLQPDSVVPRALAAAGMAPALPPPLPRVQSKPAARSSGSKKKGDKRKQKANAAAQAVAAAATRAPSFTPPAGCYRMLVARVALGRQSLGKSGMRRPEAGFDSVNSGNAGVVGAQGQADRPDGKFWCHVVFANEQAYPEWLITFAR